MQFHIFCLLFATLFVAQSYGIAWKPCPGVAVSGNLKTVTVVGCSTPVCPIKKGTNATIVFDFITGAGAAIESATSIVHGVIAHVPIPFPLPQPNACLDMTCPLKPSTSYEYSSTIPVLSEYPAINVLVKWELKPSSGDDVYCVMMPIKISG